MTDATVTQGVATVTARPDAVDVQVTHGAETIVARLPAIDVYATQGVLLVLAKYVAPPPSVEVEWCPTDVGLASDLCITGQTSLPLTLCGKEQALERTCVAEYDLTVHLGIGITFPTRVLHIAFQTTLFADMDNEAFYEEVQPPMDPTPPQPYYTQIAEYYSSVAFKYKTSNPIIMGEVAQNCYVYIDGEWHNTTDFTIVGMPLETVDPFWFYPVTFDPGEVTAGAHYDDPAGPVTDPHDLVYRYEAHTGAVIPDLPVPDHPDLVFQTGPLAIEVWSYYINIPGTVDVDKFAFPGQWLYTTFGPRVRGVISPWPPTDITIEYNDILYSFYGTQMAAESAFLEGFNRVMMPDKFVEDVDQKATVYVLMRGTGPSLSFEPPGTGGSLPPGAVSHLDFVNRYYWSDGGEQVITTLLGDSPNTTQAGGQFNTGAILDQGMLISNNGNLDAESDQAWTNRPYAIGTFYDDLANALMNGGRVVIDALYQHTPYGTLIGFYDDISANDCFDWVSFEPDEFTDGYDLDIDCSADLATTTDHLVDMTLNVPIGGGSARYTATVDGTPYTQDVTYTDPFPTTTLSYITIGHDGDDSVMLDVVYIKSITVYPP